MMIVRFLSWIFLEVRKSQNILGFWRVAWLVIPCHKWIFKSGFYDLILWIFPTICRNRARLTRKYTRVPRGRIYKEITHQNFESVNCSWNSSSWISVCRMKRRRTRKRRRRRRKQMNGSANWDLSTNLLVPDKKKILFLASFRDQFDFSLGWKWFLSIPRQIFLNLPANPLTSFFFSVYFCLATWMHP